MNLSQNQSPGKGLTFVRTPHEVVRDRRLNSNDRDAYMQITDVMPDRDGYREISFPKLAEKMGRVKSTAELAVKNLIRLGHIVQASGGCNRYRLTHPIFGRVASEDPPDNQAAPARYSGDTPPDNRAHIRIGNNKNIGPIPNLGSDNKEIKDSRARAVSPNAQNGSITGDPFTEETSYPKESGSARKLTLTEKEIAAAVIFGKTVALQNKRIGKRLTDLLPEELMTLAALIRGRDKSGTYSEALAARLAPGLADEILTAISNPDNPFSRNTVGTLLEQVKVYTESHGQSITCLADLDNRPIEAEAKSVSPEFAAQDTPLAEVVNLYSEILRIIQHTDSLDPETMAKTLHASITEELSRGKGVWPDATVEDLDCICQEVYDETQTLDFNKLFDALGDRLCPF